MVRGPYGVILAVLDCDIVIKEFELQSRNYVHFRTYTLRKAMNPFLPPAMGCIIPLLLFYKDGTGSE